MLASMSSIHGRSSASRALFINAGHSNARHSSRQAGGHSGTHAFIKHAPFAVAQIFGKQTGRCHA
jgi:hypothetical protein